MRGLVFTLATFLSRYLLYIFYYFYITLHYFTFSIIFTLLSILYYLIREVVGADALATGHYVQSNAGDDLEYVGRLAETGEPLRLFKGVDPSKDQSFFLSRILQVSPNWLSDFTPKL